MHIRYLENWYCKDVSFSQMVYRFSVVPVKILASCFMELDNQTGKFCGNTEILVWVFIEEECRKAYLEIRTYCLK